MKKILHTQPTIFDGITSPYPSKKRENKKSGHLMYVMLLFLMVFNLMPTKVFSQCPGLISNVAVTAASSTSISASWPVPIGANIYYVCELFNSSGTMLQTTGDISSNYATFYGLAPGYYKVAAIAKSGACGYASAGTASTLIYIGPVCNKPSAPTSLSGSAASYSSAFVSWTASSSGDNPITYNWYVRQSSNGGIAASGIGTAYTSGSAYGLTASTTYYLEVYAINSCGNSSISSSSTFTTPAAPPSPPSSISVSASTVCSGGLVTLTANNPIGTVYWYVGGCGSSYVGTGTSINVYPTSGTTYYAMNFNGVAFSTSCASTYITVNPPAPAAPSSASASSIGMYSANISWAASSNATNYYYVVSTSPSASYTNTNAGTSTSVSGLTAGTTYYLRVFAYNSCGSSAYTTSSAFTTLPPPTPTITSFSPTTGTLGTSVVITGTNFTGATSVKFNGVAASSYTVNSATQITAVVPSGLPSGTISVTTPSGSITSSGSLTVNKINQTISFSALAAKTYGDGTYTISATGGASGNPVTFTSSDPTVATCTGTNGTTITILKVGPCTIYANQAGASDYNAAAQVGQSLTINKKALTVTDATTANKEYDGTTDAAVTGGSLIGIVNTDDVTLTQSGTYANKTVGNAKAITSTCTIGGADVGNYSLTPPVLTVRNITAKELTIVDATTVDKVYDGNTTAAISGGALVGLINLDVVNLIQAGTYADKNVSSTKAITSTCSISGTDAANYTLTQPTLTARDITARALTVTATGINKVYDANTDGTVTLSDDRVGGDVMTTAYTTATFDDKLIGTGKALSVSGISLTGTDAGNYTFNTTTTTTASITAKVLTITASGIDKEYDQNTTATVNLSDNRVSGDVFTSAYTTASYDDKNVDTGKTVSVSGISISGTDVGNYTFNTTTTTTAKITAKALAVTATGINKVYNANTTGTVTLSDDRISGDALTTAYAAATFDDKNVNTGKNVSVTGISISGTDAANYAVNTSTATTADITARALAVTATGINKEYDGNPNGTVTLSDDRESGDVLTIDYTASYANKVIGTGKVLSVSGIAISSTDAGNYTVNTTTATTADITAKALTITATGIDKVYDKNTTATVNLTDNRVSGDVFTSAYTTASYTDQNVATGKPVSVSGISISGTDIGNYTFNTTASTTANITPKALNVTATATTKAYDGNNNAAVTLTAVTLSDDRISGDVLTTAYTTATFDDKNVDIDKTVTVGGISISGTDAANYAANLTTTTTADITFRTLKLTGSNADKVYDGTVNATVTLTDDRILGDDISFTYTSAKFPDKFVGTAKRITVSGITLSGNDVQNYSTINTYKFNANITARPLTVEGITATDRIYDATTAVTLAGGTLNGVILGDVVTLSLGTGVFVDKTAGENKAITTSGYSIGGTSVANYILAEQPTGVTANISRKEASIVGATASNKVYDGTTDVVLSGETVSGVILGDVVTIAKGTGTFADKMKETNKTVTASGYLLSGADGANYSLVAQPIIPNADITGTLVSITGVTAANKSYDGSAVATLTGGTLVGVLGTDDVTITAGTGAFNDETVGSNKAVTATAYAITGADAGNYTLTAQPIILNAEITRATLTITADTKSKVYGAADPSLTYVVSGYVNGDTEATLLTPITISRTAGENVASYTITPSGATSDNYNIVFVTNDLSIGKAELTITADAQSKIYAAADPSLTYVVSGFVNGDTESSLLTPVSISRATGETVAAYTITPSGATSDNYNIAFVDGFLTIVQYVSGDTNGDGVITAPEVLGDTNGDGIISGTEIAGDTNGDGVIGTGEIAGNTGGTRTVIAGDTNGDGVITAPEVLGDTNGDGIINETEIAGDTNGDGVIGTGEIAGNTGGTGTVIAGDTNGDGIITAPEVLGDTNGNGIIDGTEIAGDASGDGIIGTGEIAGNTGGTGTVIAGDTNGDGLISALEVLGDTNGDGIINGTEIAGDTNGDGIIGTGEIAGNTGGTGTVIAGDTNGDGVITAPEVLGDTNGDGIIDGTEIAGDTNGDGIIGMGELANKTFDNYVFNMYPNPAKSIIYLSLGNVEQGFANISICNSIGQLVLIDKKEIQNNKISIDVSSLPSGLYILTFKANGIEISKKLLIN